MLFIGFSHVSQKCIKKFFVEMQNDRVSRSNHIVILEGKNIRTTFKNTIFTGFEISLSFLRAKQLYSCPS